MGWLQDIIFRYRLDVVSARRLEQARQLSEKRLVHDAKRLLSMNAFSQANGSERDLVMGLALGYGVKELAPFVVSLRQSGYDGDVVLLTHGCDAQTVAFLQVHQVRMVPFTTISMIPMSMNSSRMFRYLDWLLEALLNQPKSTFYRQILLCDVRDVIFQGNPFAKHSGENLSFFLESNQTIGSCPVNSDWMRRAYGNDVVQELQDYPVSCAGTLIGSSAAVFQYLLHMVQHIINVAPNNRFSGVDQAIHNYILAKRLVPGSVSVKNAGLVMTVPSTNPTGLKLLQNGQIQNPNGSISEIVHQYDRDTVIAHEVVTRYDISVSAITTR
jgi:hypothetical protein